MTHWYTMRERIAFGLRRNASTVTLYNVLGVSRRASAEELRAAYLVKVKQWHPDRHRGNEQHRLIAEAKLKELNRAYDTLKDERARGAYDSDVEVGMSSQPDRQEVYRMKKKNFRLAWALMILPALGFCAFFWRVGAHSSDYPTARHARPSKPGNALDSTEPPTLRAGQVSPRFQQRAQVVSHGEGFISKYFRLHARPTVTPEKE
jgi:curved DNA-binding protein CbpA